MIFRTLINHTSSLSSRSKVRERILKNLEEQAKGISVGYGQIGAHNFTMTGLPSVYQSGLPFTTPETYVPPGYTHALTQVLIFNNSNFSFNQVHFNLSL